MQVVRFENHIILIILIVAQKVHTAAFTFMYVLTLVSSYAKSILPLSVFDFGLQYCRYQHSLLISAQTFGVQPNFCVRADFCAYVSDLRTQIKQMSIRYCAPAYPTLTVNGA